MPDGDRAEPAAGRDDLRADCARCFALCCVAPAFAASADFALDKPAGHACPNLRADFGCGIHPVLAERGFAGCTVYDCFGAGQKVAQVTFGGRDWRQVPTSAALMFDVFTVMRHLHELLWYLTEALTLSVPPRLRTELNDARTETERLTRGGPEDLAAVDVEAQRRRVSDLLRRTSAKVRAGGCGPRVERRGADLIGAALAGSDLRGANLRGAYLIAADLRGADVRGADVIGADFRDADIRGADLTGCLFLVQSQLDAARGDAATRLTPSYARPARWGPAPARPG